MLSKKYGNVIWGITGFGLPPYWGDGKCVCVISNILELKRYEKQ